MKQRVSRLFRTSEGKQLVSHVFITVDSEWVVEAEVSADDADAPLGATLGRDRLLSFAVQTDRPLRIKANDPTTPDGQIDVDETTGYIWYAASGEACPFTDDVRGLYLTNTGSGDARFTLVAGLAPPA